MPNPDYKWNILDLQTNSFLITFFLNETEINCLPTIKWFHVLQSNTDSFIWTQLKGFKYSY